MKSAKYFVMFGTCGTFCRRTLTYSKGRTIRNNPGEGGGDVWCIGSVTAFIQSPASTVKFFYTFQVQQVKEVLTGCTASLV